jgi:hypothetical protein
VQFGCIPINFRPLLLIEKLALILKLPPLSGFKMNSWQKMLCIWQIWQAGQILGWKYLRLSLNYESGWLDSTKPLM